MMSFLNFDLAKALTEERRAKALAARDRRRRPLEEPAISGEVVTKEADIVELVFPTRCESDQIGA